MSTLVAPPPKVKLALSATVGKAFAPLVRRHLRAAWLLLARPPRPAPLRELSVVFVGDRRMADLHVRFMNIPGPTDVLTFPLDLDPRGRPTSGEVYVCIPEARRRARLAGVPVAHEALLYALHGLLHLCGYDDRTDADFRKMHRREDDILRTLGVGRVFAPDAPRPAAANRPAARRSGVQR